MADKVIAGSGAAGAVGPSDWGVAAPVANLPASAGIQGGTQDAPDLSPRTLIRKHGPWGTAAWLALVGAGFAFMGIWNLAGGKLSGLPFLLGGAVVAGVAGYAAVRLAQRAGVIH